MIEAKQPIRLQRDPINSVIFEVRFASIVEGLPDLLPGLLYSHLGSLLPRVNALPISDVPLAVRKTMPDWYYHPVKQMSSPSGQLNLNIGYRSFNVEMVRPYPGWAQFSAYIHTILDAVHATKIASTIERYSLRYQNVLPSDVLPELGGLKLKVDLADLKIDGVGFSLRSEIDFEGTRTIVQIATNATGQVVVNGNIHQSQGTLLDIDILMAGVTDDFFRAHRQLINRLHDAEKKIFFGLLTEAVVERLEPIWE